LVVSSNKGAYMRGSKVASKKTGSFRRNNPVIQTSFVGVEELYRAFSRVSCNKCNGTGRRKKIQDGFSINQATGQKMFLGNLIIPCKCVPLSLFGY